MALFAFNLTNAPLALAAGGSVGGNPTPVLPASSANGVDGPAFNCTSELAGLSGANYAAIDAQRAAGQVRFEWVSKIDYPTAGLQVDAPTFGQGSADITIFVAVGGNDANPGTAIAPVLTIDRALDLIENTSDRTQTISLGAGSFTQNRPAVFAPKPVGGRAAPLVFQGSYTNELGDRACTAGSTAIDVIDSTLATIRTGAAATVIAGAPAGSMRVGGLAGMVAADVGRFLMLRLAGSKGNRGWFRINVFIDANTVEVLNPQAVVPDARNGNIYWQESFEGGTIFGVAGANAGFRRMIRDHGVESTGTVDCVSVAASADNDRFTVNDGVNPASLFEYKVTGGYVPTGGAITIDISALADTSAAGVAAATAASIIAQAPAVLRVEAFASAKNARVNLRNMQLGTVGNQAIVKVVGAFAVAGMTGGVGSPTTTFRVNKIWDNVPVVGDTFRIEKPASEIVVTQPSPLSSAGVVYHEGKFGFFGLRLRPVNAGMFFFQCEALFEGVEVALEDSNGNFISASSHAAWMSLSASVVPRFVASPTNPFGTLLSFRGTGLFVHGGTIQAILTSFVAGFMTLRNMTVIGGRSHFNFSNLDAKRTTMTFSQDCLLGHSSDATLFGRVQEQRTVSAADALITMRQSFGGGLSPPSTDIFQQLDLSDSGGDALQLQRRSSLNMASVSGFGNVGVGMRVSQASAGVTGAALTVTGTAGDMIVGGRVNRTWTDYGANAPVSSEVDIKGDGSRLASTTSVARQILPLARVALGNFAAGGSIGTAAATVDIADAIAIGQTTAGQTVTLPSPTDTASIRGVNVYNTGNQSVNVQAAAGGGPLLAVAAGRGGLFVWDGTTWQPAS